MEDIKVNTILMDVDGTMTRVINPKQEPQHHFWNILVNMVMEKYDLTTEAAVTKMMWALAQENTDELLTADLCGEIRPEG